MPRIYKGSETTLRLLVHTCTYEGKISDLKIALFTNNPDVAVEFTDRYTIEGNVAVLTVPNFAFGSMEDGVISYIAQGMIDDDTFLTQRQSNYFLKTPANFTPAPIPEDIVLGELTTMIVENGVFEYTPTDVDAWNKTTIEVNVPDTNGSYDEGFNVGYEQGKTDGVNEQISKLESINITENGTYTKEDGYNVIEVNVPDLNGSYDEGYTNGYEKGLEEGVNNAGEIIATNARILNVTENGAYLSKYSDPILIKPEGGNTGFLPDGTEFFSYATLNNVAFKTDILGVPDTYFELWWRDTNTANKDYAGIIGVAHNSDPNILFKLCKRSDGKYRIEYGTGPFDLDAYEFKYDMSSFTHIILSNKGLWLNDELMYAFNFTKPFKENLEFYCQINDLEGDTYANGDYGVVVINNKTFTPSQNGFIEYNTKADVERIGDGNYSFTERNVISVEPEGELIKTVNVNVTPKINLAKDGIKFGYSSINTVPEWADFTGITSMRNMFSNCGNLKTIPLIDTSKVTDMTAMFENCGSLIEVPELNTDAVENITSIFNGCYSLVSIPAINGEKIRISTWDPIFGYSNLDNLTDFGGFINLKTSISNDYSLTKVPNLSYQSCINILNGLYDFVGNGETPSSDQGQLKVHPNFLDKVGEEIVIGTNKGWIITA